MAQPAPAAITRRLLLTGRVQGVGFRPFVYRLAHELGLDGFVRNLRGDVEVVLWGSPIEIGKQDRIKAVRDRLFRSHLLPAFQMSDPQMDRYLDEIARLQRLIQGAR